MAVREATNLNLICLIINIKIILSTFTDWNFLFNLALIPDDFVDFGCWTRSTRGLSCPTSSSSITTQTSKYKFHLPYLLEMFLKRKTITANRTNSNNTWHSSVPLGECQNVTWTFLLFHFILFITTQDQDTHHRNSMHEIFKTLILMLLEVKKLSLNGL